VDRQSQPGAKPEPNLTVRTALDRAAARISGKFGDQPLIEASIRHTIGAAYSDLSLYPQAERELNRALQLRKRILGERNSDTLQSESWLASLYRQEGKTQEAEKLTLEALEDQRRVLGKEHPDTLRTEQRLAALYSVETKYAQAEALNK
jgi:tetratricopeptide (TPR) repeat protein